MSVDWRDLMRAVATPSGSANPVPSRAPVMTIPLKSPEHAGRPPHVEPEAQPADTAPSAVDGDSTDILVSALELIADAIGSAPRAPSENILAMAHVGNAIVDTRRALRELTGAALGWGQALTNATFQDAAAAIRRRDYLHAYALLDGLPGQLRMN